MSIRVWVDCDGLTGEECDEDFLLAAADVTVEDARAAAAREGWDFIGGLDLCPDHKPVVSR